jgi:hypothetical protein
MRPPPPRTDNDREPPAQKIALFLSRPQIEWLTVAVRCLPREPRKTLERALSQQLAEHSEVH